MRTRSDVATSASQARNTAPAPTARRWIVLCAATLVLFAIGQVYTWSVFATALSDPASAMRLDAQQASLPFIAALSVVFAGAFVGGRLQDAYGPRLVVLGGGMIFAAGVIGASFAVSRDQLWLLVVGYGVVGGFGLGVVYVVPAALLQKWFPDRRGLATATAVAGFGVGGVLTLAVATPIIARHPDHPTAALGPLGVGYLVMILIGGSLLRNPPAPASGRALGNRSVSVMPPRAAPNEDTLCGDVALCGDFTLREALRTPQWWALMVILAANVGVSVGFIATAAGAARTIAGLSPAGASALVSTIAVFNGLGRIVWAAVSEQIGRMAVFTLMFFVQSVCLFLVSTAHDVTEFYILASVIGLCCGGGFGVMPATVGDYFGLAYAGAIYGLMLVGWSVGGVAGPYWVGVVIASPTQWHYTYAYVWLGIVAAVVGILPQLCHPPTRPRLGHRVEVDGAGHQPKKGVLTRWNYAYAYLRLAFVAIVAAALPEFCHPPARPRLATTSR